MTSRNNSDVLFVNLIEVKGMNGVVVSRSTVGQKRMGSNPRAVVLVCAGI